MAKEAPRSSRYPMNSLVLRLERSQFVVRVKRPNRPMITPRALFQPMTSPNIRAEMGTTKMTLLPTIRPPIDAGAMVRPTYWKAIRQVVATVPAQTSHRRNSERSMRFRRRTRRSARVPPIPIVMAPNRNGLTSPKPPLITTNWEPNSRLAARERRSAARSPVILMPALVLLPLNRSTCSGRNKRFLHISFPEPLGRTRSRKLGRI